MGFALIDSLSLPGNPAKPNDDAFAHFERAAVVLDGATGLGDPLLPGDSDAAWIARFGANRLMAQLKAGATAQAAVKAALEDAERSFKGLQRRAPAETYEIPFAAMMLAVARPGGFDALWFGDCAALVKRSDAPAFVVGEAFDKKSMESSYAARLAARTGLSPASSANRPEYLPALRKARNRANTIDGTWAFGPDARAAGHVRMKRVEAPSGTCVLVASDGFLALAGDYARYDLDGLITAAETKGLAELGRELRAVEDGDPEGRKFPRFKTSDDATAVLLRVT
jgi:hypothetical protein